MSEEKVGLLINLFDKDVIYSIDTLTPTVEENTTVLEDGSTYEAKSTPPKEVEENSEVKVVKLWGNNAKGILILLDEPSSELVPQKSLTVLGKIFEALQLNLENDAAIINLSFNSYIKREDLKEYSPKLIIHFGINMFRLGFTEVELHNYELKEVDNTTILSSETIDKMMAKVEAKKAFWLAVQRAVTTL